MCKEQVGIGLKVSINLFDLKCPVWRLECRK
jgi:hypothetical protein